MAAEFDPSELRRRIVRVVLTYVVIAALWILFSDQALEAIVRDPALLIQVSILKGWAFIAVTALILYFELLRNVTPLVRLETQRIQSLRLLESLAEASDDAIFAKDLEGRYILCNQAAARFVGKSPREVLGQDDRALFPAEQAAVIMATDRRLVAEGGLQSFTEELQTVLGRRTFLATKGPLRDGEGRVIGQFGIARDITARNAAEEAVREREQTLSAIIGNSPSALSLKHPDGRYALANPNLQRIHHLTEAEIIGKTDADLFPPEVAQAIRANDELVLGTRARHSAEELVPVDGRPRLFMSHMFPVTDDAGTVRYICRIAFDITDRKAADAALVARNNELERFNRAMVGRELDMLALKQRINALSRELGRPSPYAEPAGPGLGAFPAASGETS